MRRIAVLLPCLLSTAVACGGSTPGSPSPVYPEVAGVYSGVLTLTDARTRDTVACPSTTSVTQTGATVTIAPITLAGSCDGVTLPVGATLMSPAGVIGNRSGDVEPSDCGGGRFDYNASGTFVGRELRLTYSRQGHVPLSGHARAVCSTFDATGTLSR